MSRQLSKLVLSQGWLWKVWEKAFGVWDCIAVVGTNSDAHALKNLKPEVRCVTRGNTTAIIGEVIDE